MYLSFTDLTLLCVPVHVCLHVLCCSCLVLFFEFVTSDFDYDVDYGLVLTFGFTITRSMSLLVDLHPRGHHQPGTMIYHDRHN